ncbi:Pentatricopeptide repeat-containing protein [Chlorella vulgaris]
MPMTCRLSLPAASGCSFQAARARGHGSPARAPVTARAATRPTRTASEVHKAAAGPVLLEVSTAAATVAANHIAATPKPASGVHVQPQARQQRVDDSGRAALSPGPQRRGADADPFSTAAGGGAHPPSGSKHDPRSPPAGPDAAMRGSSPWQQPVAAARGSRPRQQPAAAAHSSSSPQQRHVAASGSSPRQRSSAAGDAGAQAQAHGKPQRQRGQAHVGPTPVHGRAPAPPASAARRPRRLTAAPGTAIGQPAADPRLVTLTQQLIQCKSQAEMCVVLQREHAAGLAAADVRRLLTYLERQRALGVALAAFHAIKAAGLPWAGDAVLRTKLIKMHSRSVPDTTTALALYDEMRRDGILPDAVTFNTCLSAAGLGRHWPRVLALLDDMRAVGVAWDAYTCSALLSACQAAGRWEQALEWFRQAQAMPGLQLNVVHYTTLMSCLQKAGQWEQSMRVYRHMEAASILPDVVAHNAAITACAQGGDWQAAWAVFLSMKQAGLRPSAVSYNALISACERCGQADRALEVFDVMRRRGQHPNAVTYNTLISACAKAGRYAKAQELHAAMVDAGLADDVFTLTALITACERIDHWQGAEDHFLEFQARGVPPNTVAYNRLISALGRGCQWERALAAFHAMQAGGGEAVTSSSSSSRSRSSSSRRRRTGGGAFRRDSSGSTPVDAEALLAAPVSGLGSSMDGTDAGLIYASCAAAKPDRITYGSLIAALERGGQWERALALFEEMQAAGIQPNGYIFTSLINACEKGGQWERAVKLFRLMQGQDIPVDSMAMVARKALYAFPQLIRLMPAPLLQAARATVDSGRAARQWIEEKKRDEAGS